jgi:hypothetical protein
MLDPSRVEFKNKSPSQRPGSMLRSVLHRATLDLRFRVSAVRNQSRLQYRVYEDMIDGDGQPFEFDSMLSQIKFLASASEGTAREALDHIVDVLSELIPR